MGALGIPGGVLRRAAAVADTLGADAGELLTGRAALLGLTPRGRVSAGGATRLMPTVEGWCALTLSRDDDIAAVPALLELDSVASDPWPDIHRWAATRTADSVVQRARLLGLPAARLGESSAAVPRVLTCGEQMSPRPLAGLLVADLTSLWAGPLCGQLLARAGAVVVKVESPSRPDGTRGGDPAFFDWMNGGKLSYSLDFDRDGGRLAALLAAADVVLGGIAARRVDAPWPRPVRRPRTPRPGVAADHGLRHRRCVGRPCRIRRRRRGRWRPGRRRRRGTGVRR